MLLCGEVNVVCLAPSFRLPMCCAIPPYSAQVIAFEGYRGGHPSLFPTAYITTTRIRGSISTNGESGATEESQP